MVKEIVITFAMDYQIEITTKMNIDVVFVIETNETIRPDLQLRIIVNYIIENAIK